MKKAIIILTAIICTIVLATGCYYDKEDLVYPTTNCDTTNLTYDNSIRDIIVTNCYACHSGTAEASFGVKLDSYSLLKLHADDGDVVNRITSTDPAIMMPKGGPRLSDCNIAKIKAWVNHGSPQ